MPEITLDQIKSLREKTGISTMSCKKSLVECDGDEQKAIELLRKNGELKAQERSEKSTSEGMIVSYVHTNSKIGVLISLGCETDFVARNDDFKNLGRDIAMHVAAMNPLYLSPEDVPPELVEKEVEIWKSELVKEKKPQHIWDKILEGKINKFTNEISLLKQPFVKNPDLTIEKLISEHIAKLGENIQIKRFVRLSI